MSYSTTTETVTVDRPGPRARPSIVQEWWVAVASPVTVLALWEVMARIGIIDPRILPPPSVVAVGIVNMTLHGGLLLNSGYTIARFLVGFALGTVPGLFIGLTMGLFRWPRVVLQPLVAVFYPLPRIAMFPLVLILVGLNETSNIIMIALGPFFTMIITTMAAVLSIDPIFRDVAASFETRPKDLYMRVVLPAALPVIMGGVRVSMGLALLATIAVEFLVGNTGIGYVIWNSWQILSLLRSMVGLVAAGIIGFLSYIALGWVERRLVPWQ